MTLEKCELSNSIYWKTCQNKRAWWNNLKILRLVAKMSIFRLLVLFFSFFFPSHRVKFSYAYNSFGFIEKCNRPVQRDRSKAGCVLLSCSAPDQRCGTLSLQSSTFTPWNLYLVYSSRSHGENLLCSSLITSVFCVLLGWLNIEFLLFLHMLKGNFFSPKLFCRTWHHRWEIIATG